MTGPMDESGATGLRTKAPSAPSPAATPPPYASPRNRERLLRTALRMTAAAAALTALAALERYAFASEALRLGAVSPARENALSQHRTVTDIVVVVTVLAAAILWLLWFSQIYGNLLSLGATWTRLSRRTAVMCCAVPVINLYLAPWLIAEVWHVSDPEGDRRQYPEDTKRWRLGLAVIWSLAGVLTLVAAVLGQKMSSRTLDHLERVRSGSLVQVGAAVLVVMSALLTARLAAALTARQEARAAHLEAMA
jgi:hypothetical protein